MISHFKSKGIPVSKQLPVSSTLPVTLDTMQRAAKLTLAIHPVPQHFRPQTVLLQWKALGFSTGQI